MIRNFWVAVDGVQNGGVVVAATSAGFYTTVSKFKMRLSYSKCTVGICAPDAVHPTVRRRTAEEVCKFENRFFFPYLVTVVTVFYSVLTQNATGIDRFKISNLIIY